MSDFADHAQALSEAHLARSLSARGTGSSAHPSTGICTDCGCAIEPARLKVLPSAQRCIRCQKEVEERTGS